MAIDTKTVRLDPTASSEAATKDLVAAVSKHQLADLDVSKLTITLTDKPKPLTPPESLVFGKVMTDHMLVANFDPTTGWSSPEIKPYAPLTLDPTSSCFHYCPNVFEGMKAYLGSDGKPRLFRPKLNVARLATSAARVSLPPFDQDAMLKLIERLVVVDSRWIPAAPGYSMYIRPTIIGTRSSLGVAASDSAMIFIILTPSGPYFRTPEALSILATGESVRAWPGGTGGHKLGVNYSPGFLPQQIAAKQGYQQCLWLLGDTVTEAGAMNFFVILKRDDGDLDLVTPPLDGLILPGITRASCLALTAAHSPAHPLPEVSGRTRIHAHERPFTMAEVQSWVARGQLLEAFGVGTAVLVAPVGRIGYQGRDIDLPKYPGVLGPVGSSLWKMLVDIQTGRVQWDDWSVICQ
ncbi:branched-chain amino acid aminotransferase II [Athelia psychrophila]|uniref:Branched-chain-amino-acid aminotransferase n=1 Tax=Athelia psychrophila TaxID=1759441 RepID=A0A166KN31_9AGAM|nr:branched-chain amino acid aminotransferase II [Fibularhizoctonia sp. CBS 109695]